ncbi:metallophosphoesterase [Candidatus Dojkabacteria bacterium]|jgi:serine/threonine protein phosphatase 1|nr:metallophosphoesterase [Candidatus Dojkabacteria bacterium]
MAVKHVHYSTNGSGRDFILGDLHGCFDQLICALRQIGFDFTVDRLFSTGDLCDRGPKSFDCVDLLYESWFHPVQGNHECLMWNSIISQNQGYINCWMQNGGLWFIDYDQQLLHDIAILQRDLPLIISVGEGSERFNIVHAEITKKSTQRPATNNDINNWTFTSTEEDDLLWGRNIIGSRTDPFSHKLQDNEEGPVYQSDDLSVTYVGHSIVHHRPKRIQQQIFIDTGCFNGLRPKNEKFQEQYPLTIACPQEQIFYQYITNWKKIVKYSYNKMETYK